MSNGTRIGRGLLRRVIAAVWQIVVEKRLGKAVGTCHNNAHQQHLRGLGSFGIQESKPARPMSDRSAEDNVSGATILLRIPAETETYRIWRHTTSSLTMSLTISNANSAVVAMPRAPGNRTAGSLSLKKGQSCSLEPMMSRRSLD